MSRHLDKKKQNRRQILWTLSAVTITVLGMTVYDMRFREYGAAVPAPAIGDYYVAADSDLAALPDDYSGVTIFAGTLQDGALAGASHPHRNFAQRELSLAYRLPALTETDADAILPLLQKDVQLWENKSNTITDVVLDIRDAGIPLGLLQEFSARLRKKLGYDYRLSYIIAPLDPADPMMTADAAGRAGVYKELIRIAATADAGNAVAVITAMDKLDFPFFVYAPAGTQPDHFAAETAAKAKYLRKIIPALSSAAPATAKDQP